LDSRTPFVPLWADFHLCRVESEVLSLSVLRLSRLGFDLVGLVAPNFAAYRR
jgi:hypothetical protein